MSGFNQFVCYSKQISGCKHLFQLYLQHQVKDVTSKYNCSFVTALKNSLKECMTVYKFNDIYCIAVILDPSYCGVTLIERGKKMKTVT